METKLSRTQIIIGICGIVVLLGLVAIFSQYLGARVIGKGSPRLNVHQGENVTFTLAGSTSVRKLEICIDKPSLLFGYSDYTNCGTLQDSVRPHATSADVVIPRNMSLGRAIVITRTRDANGALVPSSPSDEKIALMILAYIKPTPTPAPVSESSGGSNGGGGGDSSNGEESSSNGGDSSNNQANLVTYPIIVNSIHENSSGSQLLIDYYSQSTTNYGFRYRQAGDTLWHRPKSGAIALAAEHAFLGELNIGSEIVLGKPVDIFFFAENADANNPTKIYTAQVCGNGHFCSQNIAVPNASVDTDIRVSNISSSSKDAGWVTISFSTNKPVFLSQMKVKYRPVGASSWQEIDYLFMSKYATFYTQSTSHSVLFGGYELLNRGGQYEFQVFDLNGSAISSPYLFTNYEGAALQFVPMTFGYGEFPKRFLMSNGALVRWNTNQPSSTEAKVAVNSTSQPSSTVFSNQVLKHIMPLVITTGVEVDLMSKSSASGQSVTYHDYYGGPSEGCKTPSSEFIAKGLPQGVSCIARGGVGPISGVNVGANVPWVIYCNGQQGKVGRVCSLCQFAGGNFDSPLCASVPANQAGW